MIPSVCITAPSSGKFSLSPLQIGNTNGNHTLRITDGQSLNLSGANGFIVGTETDNGIANWRYFVLATTNLMRPLNPWPRVATNAFDGGGNFNFTNSFLANAPQQFFMLQPP